MLEYGKELLIITTIISLFLFFLILFFHHQSKISKVSPNSKLNALAIFLGMVIIIGGLSPPLAALTFTRLRTIFFSFNKIYSLS